MSLTIWLLKNNLIYNQVLNDVPKSDQQASQIINTILRYSFNCGVEGKEDLQLSLLFNIHTFSCQEVDCPCQQNKSTSIGCGIIQELSPAKGEEPLEENTTDAERLKMNKQYELPDSKVRNAIIMKFTLKKFLKLYQSKVLRFLEIFINVYYFKKPHASFYSLMKIKNKCSSSFDKHVFSYLRILTVQKLKDYEQESKIDIFNVEKTIEVETKMQLYLKMIYETSILMERFWIKLCKSDFVIFELQDIGQNIVGNYLKVKFLFDDIIQLSPENREAVSININFHQNVMHFEMEAHLGMNHLKNIDQKNKIIRLNQYGGTISKVEQGIMLLTINHYQRSKIIFCNKNILDFLQYQSQHLLGKDLSILLPKQLVGPHNEIIEIYVTSEHKRFSKSTMSRVWMKTKDEHFIPVQMNLQTCISEQKGLVVVAFINPFEEFKLQNLTYKYDQAFFVLANEANYLTNLSRSFKDQFLMNQIIYMEEQKYHLDELFTDISLYSEEELKAGVKMMMNIKFYRNSVVDNNSTFRVLNQMEVYVSILNIHIPFGPLVKEVCIIDANRDNSTHSATKQLQLEKQKNQEIELSQDSDNNEYQFEGDGRFSNSNSSVTSSQNKDFSKDIIDPRQIPQSLISLRNVIWLFFFILICTSFALLGVSVYSSNEFNKNQEVIQYFISLASNLANVRLAFRSLLFYRRTPGMTQTQFHYMESYLSEFCDTIRADDNYIKNNEMSFDTDLLNLMNGDNLRIYEATNDGTIQKTNTTYDIGLNQYITKAADFMNITFADFSIDFKGVTILTVDPNMTQIRKDAYYMYTNGNQDIRDLTIKLVTELIQKSINKGQAWKVIVLIISICCIITTIFTSSILIPFIFALEFEQQDVANKWISVSREAKMLILSNINEFTNYLHSEERMTSDYHDSKEIKVDQNSNNSNGRSSSQENFNDSNMNSILKKRLFEEEDNTDADISNFQSRTMVNLINSKDAKGDIHKSHELEKKIKFNIDEGILVQSSRKEIYKEKKSARGIQQVDFISSIYSNEEVKERSLSDTEAKIMLSEKGGIYEKEEVDLHGQQSQINKLFFISKIKKIMLILALSVAIVSFYIGAYFLSTNVFNSIANSFTYTNTVNTQMLCISEAYTFYQESISSNLSIKINYQTENASDYIQNECQTNQQDLDKYLQNPPKELKAITPVLIEMQDSNLCSIVYSNDTTSMQSCLTASNGILDKGVGNTLSYLYHFIIKRYQVFLTTNPQVITKQYIQDLMYNDTELQGYVLFIFDQLLPILNFQQTLVVASLKEYVSKQIQLIIIVFSVFILLMLLCLILTLTIIIDLLKKKSVQNRILIKLIPMDELAKIKINEKTDKLLTIQVFKRQKGQKK